MIGATTSQTLDLTLINKGDIVYGTSTIKVEIGLKIGSTVEYIPIGIYNIDDIEKTDYTIKIAAYDNMIKFERNFSTTLGDTLTLQQVVSELTRITGIQFTGSLPSYTVKKLEGFSCREILSYVASICGGNALITRDGKFTIVTPKDNSYSIGTANYIDYKREETKYKIGKISCQVGEEILSKGSIGADTMELQFENPWVTTTILNDIYTKLNGFEYLGYSMKWQGDPSVDVGDIVTITDKKGVVRKHPILSQKFTYTGGLTSEISAKGENKNKNEFSSSGPSAKKVERVVMELALINRALIDVAYIGDLTAGNIKFDTASGTIMDLQTLLVKFVSGENGQYLNLTTDNVVIANAVIKDAMIDSLSLNKLKTGTINTNNINLASVDGGLSIVGPTMQFKDSSNKVRLQLGQDTSGNFSFILRGTDGTTTLIDHTGIKEKAIADKLIKSNMVNDGAIGEQQINYSSLVTGLNKDTNTQLIKASKVAIDLTGQSLEVSFNSLKSNVDEFDDRIESNTTSITAVQGQVSILISDNSINKGDITTLKNNYTSVKATVDGISTTVASHTTSITTINTNVTNAQNTANSANTLADSKAKVFISTPTTPYKVGDIWTGGPSGEIMKCKVARASGAYVAADWEKASKYTDDTKATAVEGNLNTLTGKVTTVENNYTSLSQNLEGFKTTVASTYSTKTELSTGINGIQVGGRNLVLNSAFKDDSAKWQLAPNVSVDTTTTFNGHPSCKTTQTGLTADSWRGCINYNLSDKILAKNKIYTITCWYYVDDKTTLDSNLSVEVKGKVSGTTTEVAICSIPTSVGNVVEKKWTKLEKTFTSINDYTNVCVRAFVIRNGTVWFTDFKLEEGTKATDWSPAPEDVDSAISTVDGRVTSLNTTLTATNTKVATIETNLTSITSRVASTESSITTINGNVSSLQSRMSSAETKITDSAIVSTVRSSTSYTSDLNAKANQSALNTTNTNLSGLTTRVSTVEQSITATEITTTISSAINAGTSSISTTQFVMDKNGLTIKNGALTIKNKAGTNVLTGDTNGNLTITGTFINKNSNGVDAIKIDSTNIYFYDWDRNARELGIIYSSNLTDYPNVKGFSLAHNQQGYMTLGYRTGSNSFGSYMTFDKYSINPTYAAPIRIHEGTVFHNAVNMQDRVYIPDKICFEGAFNSTTPQIFKNTGDSRNILCTQVSVNAVNDGYMIQSNTGGVLLSILAGRDYVIQFNQNVKFNGSYTATGSKNSLQSTKSYGDRLINAFETAEYYYSDFGFGKINNNGECYISIDDILQECVNLDCEYHIFTEKYNGSITSIDRYKNYFVVQGEVGTEFSWQYIAKRIGYENVRLDKPDIVGYLDDTAIFTDEDLKNDTSEDILIQELDFKLEDILIEEVA